MLGIASKNLLRNKSRTALAMLGLVLGVITIISLVSITTGVKGIVEDTVSKMKGLSITEKDISMPVFSELPEEYADDIEGIAGVRVACPRIAFFPKSVEGKGYYELATGPVIAFDPAKEARTVKGPLPISADLYKGRYLKPNDRNAVVIGKSIAEDFHKTIGSKMEMNDEKFDVVGIYSSESEQTERQIFVTLDIGRDFGNLEAGKVRGFYVELEDPSKDQQIAKLIEIKLDDVDAQSTSEYAAQALGLLENINIFMWAISLVATAVASVGIINTMLMSVMERMKEFGVLRSMGWTSDDVMKLIVAESALIGLGGGVIGSVLGLTVVEIAKSVIDIPMRVTPELWAAAMAFSLVSGLLGGIYPAWKAGKIDPLEAIRTE